MYVIPNIQVICQPDIAPVSALSKQSCQVSPVTPVHQSRFPGCSAQAESEEELEIWQR